MQPITATGENVARVSSAGSSCGGASQARSFKKEMALRIALTCLWVIGLLHILFGISDCGDLNPWDDIVSSHCPPDVFELVAGGMLLAGGLLGFMWRAGIFGRKDRYCTTSSYTHQPREGMDAQV